MGDTTTGDPRRRNGRFASCEPCRKAKIRCDHEKPVCSRCRRRALQAKCYYHPAPLTKPPTGSPNEDLALNGHISTPTSLTTTQYFSQDQSRTTRVVTGTPSTVPNFESKHQYESLSVLNRSSIESGPRRFAYSRETSYGEHVATVAKMLSHLRHMGEISRLCHSYYASNQTCLVPPGLILPALAPISAVAERYGVFKHSDNEPALSKWAEAVLKSTSTAVSITATLTPTEFIDMHTGENLRLEYLGIILCLTARSAIFELAPENESYDNFIRDLYQCSTTCLRLARDLTPVNDAMIWLSRNNIVLTTSIEGDSSEIAWRKLGEMHSDLFAYGVHRESFNVSNTPFFLGEFRRRAFAKAYHYDKLFASIFDRPPRVLKRYSDCKMPLDLSDEEVIAEPVVLEDACRRLTEDGWNTAGKFFPSTWTRVRYLTAELREEILEGEFHTMTADRIEKLKHLSQRNYQIWESLPPHLRYDPLCWTAGYTILVCTMLAVVRLGYLQTEFQIFCLLEYSDPSWTASKLKVAGEIIALIIDLGNWRRKEKIFFHDFSYIVLSYGLAAAAVLATAAHNLVRNGAVLPPELPRATLIRNLIVFVSQLESIRGPGEANHDVCVQASRTISRTIDEVLEQDTALPGQAPVTPVMGNGQADGVDLGALHSEDWDNFDLSNWIKNVDWTSTGGHAYLSLETLLRRLLVGGNKTPETDG